jgi:hypothetical protein
MASIGPSSDAQQPRPPAGPLPSKRGEIGYVESPNGQDAEPRNDSLQIVLPARHPADRDEPTPVAGAMAGTSTPDASTNTFTLPSSSTLFSTTESTAKQRILSLLKPKKVPTYGGLLLTTVLLFACQVLFIAGTIAAWALTAMTLSRHQADSSATYFVHVLWGFAVLAQLVFLERRLYRLRAERYNYLHPTEILPTSRNAGRGNPNIGFSPWNRPPLPTYAAALAQSGTGTGDIEDHLIAIPPPPAYGNTRGSTMLLTGYLRDSLRAQRPVSEHSQTSERDRRPMSYVSNDEHSPEIPDAERALRLQATLSRLERPGSRL